MQSGRVEYRDVRPALLTGPSQIVAGAFLRPWQRRTNLWRERTNLRTGSERPSRGRAANQLCRIAVTTPTLRPKSSRRGEMIEFLAQMPTDTMIFLTMAVLSLAAILIGLTRLI